MGGEQKESTTGFNPSLTFNQRFITTITTACMVIRNVVWWLITLAWATQIFYLSTAPFSSSRSESLLAEMLASFHLNVSPDTLTSVNSLLRKLAHLIQYSIFCLLFYRCLGGWNRWRPHLARWCVLAAAIYSVTDEFHQMLVPGRGPSLVDCGIDTTGAAVAMVLVYQQWHLTDEGKNFPKQR